MPPRRRENTSLRHHRPSVGPDSTRNPTKKQTVARIPAPDRSSASRSHAPAWECRLRRSASSSGPRGRSACPSSRWGPQSGPAGIPTQSVGTRTRKSPGAVATVSRSLTFPAIRSRCPMMRKSSQTTTDRLDEPSKRRGSAPRKSRLRLVSLEVERPVADGAATCVFNPRSARFAGPRRDPAKS
jgi:hypothetical protein